MHPLRRLLGYSNAYRRDVWLACFYSVANKFFDVLPELLIGVAVDVVNQKASFLARIGLVDPTQQLLALTALTAVIWLMESWTEYLLELRWRNLAQDLQHVARLDAYAHVQKLSLEWFERNRSGNLMSVLNEDVNQMERFLNTGASSLIQVFMGTVMVGAVFFALTWKLAALALVPVPFILFGAFWFQSRLAPRYAAMREAAGATASATVSPNPSASDFCTTTAACRWIAFTIAAFSSASVIGSETTWTRSRTAAGSAARAATTSSST